MKLSFAALWGLSPVNAVGFSELCVSAATSAGPCNGGAHTRAFLGTLLHPAVVHIGEHKVAILMDGDAWRGRQSKSCALSRNAPAQKTTVL